MLDKTEEGKNEAEVSDANEYGGKWVRECTRPRFDRSASGINDLTNVHNYNRKCNILLDVTDYFVIFFFLFGFLATGASNISRTGAIGTCSITADPCIITADHI